MDEDDFGADVDDDPFPNLKEILYLADTLARDMIKTKINIFEEQLKQLDRAHSDASKELEASMESFFQKMKIWESDFKKEINAHFHEQMHEVKEKLLDIKKLEGLLTKRVLDTKVALAASSESQAEDMVHLYTKGYHLSNIIVDIIKVRLKGIQSIRFKENIFERHHLGVIQSCILEEGTEADMLNSLKGCCSGFNQNKFEKDHQITPKKFDIEVEEVKIEQKEPGFKNMDLNKGIMEQLSGPSVSDQVEELKSLSSSQLSNKESPKDTVKCIGMRKLLTSHLPLRRPQCAPNIESEAQVCYKENNCQKMTLSSDGQTKQNKNLTNKGSTKPLTQPRVSKNHAPLLPIGVNRVATLHKTETQHEIPAPKMHVTNEERKSSNTDQQMERFGLELESSHTVESNKSLIYKDASSIYKTCKSVSSHSQLCYPDTPISHMFIPGICKHVGESNSVKISRQGITSILNKISKNCELMTPVTPRKKCTSDVFVASPYLDTHTYYRKAKLVFKTSLPQSSLNKPIGVVQLSSLEIVIADTFNHRMVMFDEHGEFIKTFNVDGGLDSPSAVVQLRDGRIAVKDNICIYLFDSDGNFFSTIGKQYMRRPYGLAVDDEGNLLTFEAHSQGFIVLLTICPQKGIITSKVKVHLNIDPLRLAFSKPRFMTWYKKDKVLVVDLGLNRVYVINFKSGMVLYEFGQNGCGDGQFSDPAGISCDSLGNVYIADSKNHRIQVFDSSLNFTCVLLTDSKLVRPSGIFISPNDDLFVINYREDSIAKFSLTSKASGRMQSVDM
ncbi:uncharacterized protein [Procambarus clarkii]|uniref:uncharacterized protein n=1 Tax=Procambarus clarkii TaxID=6728 RepID=UPI0037445DD7